MLAELDGGGASKPSTGGAAVGAPKPGNPGFGALEEELPEALPLVVAARHRLVAIEAAAACEPLLPVRIDDCLGERE